MTAQVDAPHATRFVEMCKGSFHPFATLPEQAFPTRAPNATAIPIYGPAGGIILSWSATVSVW